MTVGQQHPVMNHAVSTVLGYPRMGHGRALKKATEAYWRGDLTVAGLLSAAAAIRRETWSSLAEAGLGQVPCNDFSCYDQMLDTAVLTGAIPGRHRGAGDGGDDAGIARYFAMARGSAQAPPLEVVQAARVLGIDEAGIDHQERRLRLVEPLEAGQRVEGG